MDHQQESRDPAITETETKEAIVKNDTNEKTQLVLMVYVEKKHGSLMSSKFINELSERPRLVFSTTIRSNVTCARPRFKSMRSIET